MEESKLNEFKCRLHNDGHIAIQPVLLPCIKKHLACKQCIVDSKEIYINCFGCNKKHEKSNLLLNSSIDKQAEFNIRSNLNHLFEHVNEGIEIISEQLKSKIFSDLFVH